MDVGASRAGERESGDKPHMNVHGATVAAINVVLARSAAAIEEMMGRNLHQ